MNLRKIFGTTRRGILVMAAFIPEAGDFLLFDVRPSSWP